MSMAVVCTQLSLFGPSVGGADARSYSKGIVGVSSGGLVFRPHQDAGSGKGYSCLACRASSGGSRRDYEKILARQQKRRVRHMKGVTPSTPDLIKTLDSEKRDQAKLDSYPDAVSDEEKYDDKDKENSEEEGILLPLDEAAMLSPDVASAAYVAGERVAHGGEDNNGSADITGETGGGVTDIAGVQDDPTAGRVENSSR